MSKKLIYHIVSVLGVLAGVILWAHIGHSGLFALGALLPSGTAQAGDLDRIKTWSRKYFRRVQSKIIFGEAYTGNIISSDGPHPSDVITAPPIFQVNDLSNNTSGTVVTFTLINPLFKDSKSRLNYGRVKGQKRVDSEKSGSKNNVQIALASWFQGVKEEDVVIGEKEIGMGNLYNEMVHLLSDNAAQYMDDDTIEAFLQGQSRHLYTNIASISGAVDGSAIVGSDKMAVKAPSEHPNTYAWIPNSGDTGGVLTKADSNSVADIMTLFSKISSKYSFSYALLSQIALRVRLEKIIGSTYNFNGNRTRTLVKVLCDPLAMERLRQDLKDNNAFNSAYQARGTEHPMIAQGDILFGPLLVSEQEKLYDDAFSPKNNFGVDEYDSDGDDSVTDVTKSTISRITDADGIESITIEHGERTFLSSSTAGADANIGTDGADTLGNILVLGANSLATAPGPIQLLDERRENDYGRILGLGGEHLFGTKRLDFTDPQGNFAFNQSSFRVVLYRGK